MALALIIASLSARAATWQYSVPLDSEQPIKGSDPNRAFLWIPPKSAVIRGVLVGGQLGIESEIALDPAVRRACADSDLAVVYFVPHLSAVFHFWDEKGHDGERFLKAFDDLAQRSGHPELRRVPWITMGHSTAGIFCRNVAYWKPQRVAAVLHIKSGSFHQKDICPPSGSLSGIPLLAINGQFETYGPQSGIQPELGRETQWVYVRKDIEQFQQQPGKWLISTWLDLGGDHFHGSPELSQYAALFILKTARYRIPARLPVGDGEIACLPIKREDGWLTDPDLIHPGHPPAAFAEYAGDKRMAMWHYDQELAVADFKHHQNLTGHQALSNPILTWLDDGDGWTFQASSQFLDTMPPQYGGSVGGLKVGHAATPIVYRCKINEPVLQIGPDTFRLLRPVKTVNIAAVNEGDDHYRAANRWSGLKMPSIQGRAQQIDFPQIEDLPVGSSGIELKATATSALPVWYEVDYGPVTVEGHTMAISELPAEAKLPIECKVTAWQIGNRTEPLVARALPVSRLFKIVKQ